MEKGDILGHEFMGEIVEPGSDLKDRKVGDRVVVSFPISCGVCFFCKKELFSLCENSNPNAWMAEKMFGHAPSGVLRLFAPDRRATPADKPSTHACLSPTSEQSRFRMGLPTTRCFSFRISSRPGYMGAEMCNIQPGRHAWPCGAVGQ